MNQFKKTIIRLTVMYSLIFFCFIWAFSGGIYLWTNNSLGKGYVNRINEVIEQSGKKGRSQAELPDDTATIAADVALDRLRNIILIVNGIALVLIPTLAYQLSRRSLRPLAKSQEVQQHFIANASHELRTPLAVMLGELELAAKQGRTSEEHAKTIKNTKNEVQRMTTLVKELLVLARVENGDKLQETQEVKMNDLINETINLHKSAAARKKVKITVKMDGSLVAQGKKDLLGIALGNLLDNAIKFSGNNETVTVYGSRIKNKNIVEFTNEGEIGAKDIPHLFDRFYRGDAHDTSIGSGLGLAITKQIIELHGGTIVAGSRAQKTTFSITLPSGASRQTTG
jgi:signal transduction histidine kinase